MDERGRKACDRLVEVKAKRERLEIRGKVRNWLVEKTSESQVSKRARERVNWLIESVAECEV